MKKYLFFCVFVLPLFSQAQNLFEREKRDNIWLFGGRQIKVDYAASPPEYIFEQRQIRFDFTNASICDTFGNLLFYTNGISISNFTHDTIENGGRINPGPYTSEILGGGNNIYQGALILPFPEHDNLYSVFYEERTRAPEISAYARRVYSLYYALIDMNENDGFGSVLEKDIPIIQDTLDVGKILATRHANGRDWWVVVPEYNTNRYYRILLTSEGIIDYGWQESGEGIPGGLGQSTFSSDGKKYVHFTTKSISEGQFISIHDFDRHTGYFSNPIKIMYNDTAYSAGVAISENSRFLYVSSYLFIYQYDLEADDIEASKVVIAEYDGFYDTYPPLKTRFFMAALAPDGKILINTPNSSRFLHVIHNPNKKGLACNIEQHGIELPAWNQFTMPNYPYYGLGPLDGSPADTLGIDNPPPIADFEYVQEDMSDHEVDFYNATRFSPEMTMYEVPEDAYYWTFGDWETSHDKHPSHTYAAAGTYRVCLTATNLAGSDTHCDTVVVSGAGIIEASSPLHNTRLFPNPTDGYFFFNYLLEEGAEATAFLYDVQGRLIRKRGLKTGVVSQGWEVGDLASGVYFFVVSSPFDSAQGKGVLFREKVVVY